MTECHKFIGHLFLFSTLLYISLIGKVVYLIIKWYKGPKAKKLRLILQASTIQIKSYNKCLHWNLFIISLSANAIAQQSKVHSDGMYQETKYNLLF